MAAAAVTAQRAGRVLSRFGVAKSCVFTTKESKILQDQVSVCHHRRIILMHFAFDVSHAPFTMNLVSQILVILLSGGRQSRTSTLPTSVVQVKEVHIYRC